MPSQKPFPHIEYKKILYVTDLSESGRQAFPHAAAVALRNEAQLTVFHVVGTHDLQSLASYMNDELWQELTSKNLDDARQILVSRKRQEFAISHIEKFYADYPC